MKIVFFGTPTFAAAFLKSLVSDTAFDVVAVVTQPDEPVGRKKILTPPAVKVTAAEHGIAVLQPTKMKDEAFVQSLRDLEADAFVVVAFGRILPQSLLDIPRLGCINVHPSLLPKYRGPSPVQSAILHGDSMTGVTIMKLDADMDHGPLLTQKELAIATDETPETLYSKVVDIGAPLLIAALKGYVSGVLQPIEQDHAAATLCRMFTREDGKIDWTKPADAIERQVRAFTPWPGTFTVWHRRDEPLNLKIFVVRLSSLTLPPGTAKAVDGRLFVGTGSTALEVVDIQPAGGNRLETKAFLAGYGDIDGSIFS